MISQTVMWTVDAAMVGRVGKAELAAVGLGGLLVWTLYSFFVGLTSAVNTFVAQADGAGEPRRCGVFLWQGLYGSLVAAVVIYVFRAFAGETLAVMRPSPEVLPLSTSYVKIRMLSAPFFLIHYVFMHFFRGVGDTRTPLKILAVVHGVNVIGDYALIFGKGPFPALGVDGAAWATTLANLIAAAIFTAAAFRPRLRKTYGTVAGWRFDADEMRRMLRVGLPSAVHYFLDMGSFLVFSAYVARMGTVALAVNQIAIQILALSFMPCQGFAIAATTLMGRYVGAGAPDVAKRAAYTTLKMGLCYAALIVLLCFGIPESLVRIFNGDPEVVALGRPLMYLAGVFQAFDAVQFIAGGGLRGAGDTRVPALIIIGGAWFVFLPLALLFGSVLDKGVLGAWAGAVVYIVIVASAMFRRLQVDRWREIKI